MLSIVGFHLHIPGQHSQIKMHLSSSLSLLLLSLLSILTFFVSRPVPFFGFNVHLHICLHLSCSFPAELVLQPVTNEYLYGNLPKISVIQQQLLRLAGYCYRSDETVASMILWKPKHGYRRPGRRKLDYVTLLTQDTGLTNEELCTAMSDRELWRNYVDSGAPD